MHGALTTEVDGIRHTAAPRNELRMTVEVTTDMVGTFGVASQAIEAPYPKRGEPRVPHTQRIVIYEREWDAVQKQVRTDAQIAAFDTAKAMAPADTEIVAKRRAAEQALASARTPTARERAEMALAEVDGDVFRKACQNLDTMPGCRGGLPPLLSAKVIRRGVHAPETPQNLAANANSDLAAQLARFLDERGKGKSKE